MGNREMGSREQAEQAAVQLGSGDRALRRQAAQALHELAKRRTSLLDFREALALALGDRDDQVRSAAALALLVDAWRFSGLLPVTDDLERRLVGPQGSAALAAAVEAAAHLGDLARGTARWVELLVQALPESAALLTRLAGQGADLTPLVASAAAPQGDTAPLPGDAVAALWLSALGRLPAAQLAPHLGRLRRWAEAASDDWRYDDVRYRATELLVRAALESGDDLGVRELAASAWPAVREATLDSLTSAWSAGRHAALAAELAVAHVADSAGGVRYAAIRGMARAAAAGADLPVDTGALWAALPSAQYLATGWAYPLDTTAVSDLRGESAPADLAAVLAHRAHQRADSALAAQLLALPDPEVARAVRAVLGDAAG